jgi:Endonuclease NucS
MLEREMEDLLWSHPEKFLNEPLTQFRRQPISQVGRADLVFKDRLGRLLIVEIKKGKLERGAINQLVDYFGMLKLQFPDTAVELMVIANSIPEERQLACHKHDIECRIISEKKYRDVAAEVGYEFVSEKNPDLKDTATRAVTPTADRSPRALPDGRPFKIEKAWGYWQDGDRNCYLAFVNAKVNCSVRTFDSEGHFLSREYGDGDYQNAFADRFLKASRLTLTHQPNLELSCRKGLPDWVLAEFRQQR